MNSLRITLLLSIAVLAPFNVLAAGSSEKPTSKVEKCEEGEIYDKDKKECVDEEKAALNDSDFLDNGRALAYAGRFDEAISVLNKINNKGAAALNYLGYATRSAGDLESGLQYYKAALAIDPNYTLARSYMGQALLTKGDRRGALIQLSEIEKRVGTSAREYKLLAVALLQKSLKTTATY